MHAYVSHILRKGGGGTEKGGGEMGGRGGSDFFLFSSKVAQIRHGTKKSSKSIHKRRQGPPPLIKCVISFVPVSVLFRCTSLYSVHASSHNLESKFAVDGGGGGSKPTDKNLLEISLLKGEYEDHGGYGQNPLDTKQNVIGTHKKR